MESGDDSDFDDLMFLRDVVASWPALNVDDGDSSTSSSDDENSSPAEAVRERVGFKRRPRFNDKEGHGRWYGEWGTGFWHQYVDPEAVERNDLLKDEFHQRFRIPHELFCTIYDEMDAVGLFRHRTKSVRVPPRLLLMGSFKRIASGAHWETIAECAFVSRRALCRFFDNKFLPFFSEDDYYKKHVYYPTTTRELEVLERGYRALGVPGCIGSVDGVHMPWDAAPASHTHYFYNGRKGGATYASIVTVDSDCIIMHATDGGYGASNDISLMLGNEFHEKLKKEDVYTNFEYDILVENGDFKRVKGAYTICDGGFRTHSTTIATIHAPTAFEARWTERIESCRKDVERCFGHLKKRFQILRIPTSVRRFTTIIQTWRTCCVLHNILTRRRLRLDLDYRHERVASGNFEEQDAAVIQAWAARDMEDAAFYAERVRSRDADMPVQEQFHHQERAIEERINRARMAQRSRIDMNATSVEELQAYNERQKALIIHYNSLLARGAVDHLAPARRRVVRSEEGEILHLEG